MAVLNFLFDLGIALFVLTAIIAWWTGRLSIDKVIGWVGQVVQWAPSHKSEVLRYTSWAQALTGLVLVLVGYQIGREHFQLIRDGVRAHGTIVGYRDVMLANGGSPRWERASFPIIRFQVGERTFRFRDWMSAQTRSANSSVAILYDKSHPSLAMIDRPVWNWIPWGPAIAVGAFLLLVSVFTWRRSRAAVVHPSPIATFAKDPQSKR